MSTLFYQSHKYALFNHPPFAKPVSEPISDGSHPNPTALSDLSRRLLDHYVIQFNSAACSVASVATVLNTARSLTQKAEKAVPLTQTDILNAVQVVEWKDRITPSGNKSRRGLPLAELGIAVENGFAQYQIPCDSVETVLLLKHPSNLADEKEKLKNRLIAFEKSGACFIIAHFNQGIFIKSLHIPHISPVGAYHIADNKVLVLDVDREGPGPYWLSFEKFFEGLTSDYNGRLKKYGYDGGGYVYVELK
ncbi:MAG: phytochelatin synthase [Deltaproteobacteria bacterium]|nr:phytochelatin synthase [Deltaproteobacteria bacterium]